ncbi:MAG: Imm52 family immunity protein [Pseudomonadota bacterium]
MELVFGRYYLIRASLGARPETPEALAARFLKNIDLLSAIDPLLALWLSGVNSPKKLETIRDRYAQIVAAEISRDDFGEPEPIYGYWPGAITRGQPEPSSYALNVRAGAYLEAEEFQNHAKFSTSSGYIPDPAAITYRIFKAALLAIVEAWEPTNCFARPAGLIDLSPDTHGHFREAWMQYLSAPLAARVTPPQTAVIDRFPDGGLLMSATTDTFDIANPAHLAAARDIGAATAPLNALL